MSSYVRSEPQRLAMVAKSDNNARVHGFAHRGTLYGVRAVKATFRGAIGISLLLHAVAFASVWRVLGTPQPSSKAITERDVWVGTTVSVIAEKEGHSEPSSPQEKSDTDNHTPQGKSSPAKAPRSAAIEKATREVARVGNHAAPRQVPEAAARGPAIRSRGPQTNTPRPAEASNATSLSGSDLKKAMLEASNQKEAGLGTFGAVGVDLRERRLPAAITRALPVAIGAQPGWWRGRLGTLGTLRFEVTLDDSGKIQAVDIDDETAHAWASRVVRGVGRLLSVGRYALSATTPGARQRFELTLELEQRPAPNSIIAEAGDAVDMGWEAPTSSSPGKAHIQEAQGRILRATLRVLPALKATSALQAKPSLSREPAAPEQSTPE
jgi:hypothetical protein